MNEISEIPLESQKEDKLPEEKTDFSVPPQFTNPQLYMEEGLSKIRHLQTKRKLKNEIFFVNFNSNKDE